MVRRLIADEDVAEEYKKLKHSEPSIGLAFSNTALASSSVVKLSFQKNTTSSPKSGNGFFIHIPGASKDVVLTAGHNLIDIGTKTVYSQISVSFLDTTRHQFVQRMISHDAIHICSTFKDNPTEQVRDPEARNDYGVVLLDREDGHPPHCAFGFSTLMGDRKEIRGDISITGYQAGSNTLPVSSSGPCVYPIVTGDQLEYGTKTEAGISGAPAWIGYNGLLTAVAVHNYGPQGSVRYNRGSRINHKLLRDVFGWAGVGCQGCRLQVHSLEAPQPDTPLCLAYSEEDARLVVVVEKVLDDPLRMSFDLWPVYAPPVCEGIERAPLFALRCLSKWVSWNLAKAEATLVEELHDSCMVRVIVEEDGGLERGQPIRFVLEYNGELKIAVVKTDMMKKFQLEMEGEEFSGLCFEDYFEGEPGDEQLFNEFALK